MMQNVVAVLLVLLLSFAGEAYAQASATGNAAAQANAGNANALNVNGTGNAQSITLSGGTVERQNPQPPVAPVSVPQVFQFLPNQAGMPVELTASPLDNAYLMACKPRGGRKAVKTQFAAGDTGKTKFVFSAHHTLRVQEDGATPEVEVDLTGSATIRCLGKITIAVTPEAVKTGFPIDLTAISEDAMESVAKILKGVGPEVVLLSHLGFWGGGLGLAGQGRGVTGGIGVNFGISATAGVSDVNGVNFPFSRGGMSFIVGIRVTDDDPSGVKLALVPAQPEQTKPVGGNGKKMEGTQ